MPEFDKNKVLEEILKEVPVKLNLREEVVVDGVTRVIYAFYQNSGIPDPELKYDREKNPVPTDQNSTVCEVYSVGGPRNAEFTQEHQERMKANELYTGNRREDAKIFGTSIDSFNQGPYIGFDEMDPAGEARKGYSYDFSSSAYFFAQHFNQICKRLGYDIRFINNSVELTREVEIVENENKLSLPLNVRADVGINLKNKDPTLKDVLDVIENAYKKAKRADISSNKIELYQYV